eukprot:g6216.t1
MASSAFQGVMLPVVALALLAAAQPSAPGFRLQYAPTIATPHGYTLLNTSANGAGKLYRVELPADAAYAPGAGVKLLVLEGTPAAAGDAYGELLGVAAAAAYAIQVPPSAEPLLDWLWRCSLREHVPREMLEELDAMDGGGARVGVANLTAMVTRTITSGTLPEDAWNVAALVQHEAARHAGSADCAVPPPAAVGARRGAAWKGAGHCDFFGVWGALVEDGRLLTSRNLDIARDTGLARHKLVTVYRLEGQAAPYATFGFDGFAAAIAGMSAKGLTVSEANLDNGAVGFNGLAWPLRLRQILAQADGLASARALWTATDNTAAFNFLLGSAAEPGALALETCQGVTRFFDGGDPAVPGSAAAAEAASSFTCANGTAYDGVTCSWWWPGAPAPLPLGAPLRDGVFRSNHALHPAVMATQEPLWNDTVSRYMLLGERLAEAAAAPAAAGGGRGRGMSVEAAVNVTSLLGIKGPDYGSCEAANFAQLKPHETAIVLSVTYDPSRATAYCAWEDGTGKGWTPASCNTYVKMDFARWFK